jgi:hypothetical protein
MKKFIKRKLKKIKFLLGMQTRENLFKVLPQNAICAELGVFKGEFSESILEYGKPKEAHFIDVWWSLFGETYPDWADYTDFGRLKTRDAHAQAVAKIKKYPGKNIVHVGSDLEYLREFEDAYFDWVYIDSSHEYEHTCEELKILLTKVKQGGVICGHDWLDDEKHPHYGVKRAVVEFCRDNNWEVIYKDRYLQWAIKKIHEKNQTL